MQRDASLVSHLSIHFHTACHSSWALCSGPLQGEVLSHGYNWDSLSKPPFSVSLLLALLGSILGPPYEPGCIYPQVQSLAGKRGHFTLLHLYFSLIYDFSSWLLRRLLWALLLIALHPEKTGLLPHVTQKANCSKQFC